MNRQQVLFLGRATLDVLYSLEQFPDEDAKVFAHELRVGAGGPALNAAITHSLLGGNAMLVSALGGGHWARIIQNEIEQYGVKLLDLAADTTYEAPLSTVFINETNGSRTIVNAPASQVHLRRLESDWETEVGILWGRMPTVILSDGYLLDETLTLMTACAKAGAALCLDGGSWKPGTDDLASSLTVAICSERFAVPGQATAPDAVFAWFAAKGVPYIAVTRGARSILGWDRGRRFEVEVEKIAVVDTLGAGDVLHGAFCHYFSLKPDFEEALRRASIIASISCKSLGTKSWMAQASPEAISTDAFQARRGDDEP
jgi:sugar/nucleoside kinase (ribokinase family)